MGPTGRRPQARLGGAQSSFIDNFQNEERYDWQVDPARRALTARWAGARTSTGRPCFEIVRA